MRPSYATAVLGAEVPIESIFDDVGRGLSNAVKSVSHAVETVAKPVKSVVDAVDKVYVDLTPQWLRKAAAVPWASTRFVWDAADSVARGERIDRAFIQAAKNQVAMYKAFAPIAQLGLSFVPGVGQGASAAIGAGIALADGKPITDAVLASLKSAVPGGPLAQAAVDIGVRGAVDLAQGKRLDVVALEAVRKNLPGGDAARAAFDAGLALAQGKKLQEAGMAAVANLVPNHPLAQGAFEMTKRALAGKPLTGSTHTAMTRLTAIHRNNAARGAPRPIRVRPAPPRTLTMRSSSPPRMLPVPAAPIVPDPPPQTSNVLPIALGVGALAAAGGGALWWWHRHKRPH